MHRGHGELLRRVDVDHARCHLQRPDLEGEVGITGPSSEVQAVVDLYGPTDFLQMDEYMLPGACESFITMMSITGYHNDPLSPESRLIGAPIQENPDLVAEANPITYVDAQIPPFLIAHGTKDQLVPHHQSNLLFEAMAEARVPAMFYSVTGYGHEHGLLAETSNIVDRPVHPTKPHGGIITSKGAPMTWDTVA
ncbi:prolyl oligopeptidase family serine peptidase [Kocuria sp. CPCC 205236]